MDWLELERPGYRVELHRQQPGVVEPSRGGSPLPSRPRLTMRTRHGGVFECTLPVPGGEGGGEVPPPLPEATVAFSALGERCVTFEAAGWWAYEVCLGESGGVRQFHPAGGGARESETLLGAAPEHAGGNTFMYGGGELCDLTGRPRSTRVSFACLPGSSATIASVRETHTCEYEVAVMADAFCASDVQPELLDCHPLLPDDTGTPVLGVRTGQVWTGFYSCQGEHWLRTRIVGVSEEDGGVQAVVSFRHRGGAGVFFVEGRVESGGSMSLRPSRWVARPEGFSAVELIGRLDADATTFFGVVPECDDGPFSLSLGLENGAVQCASEEEAVQQALAETETSADPPTVLPPCEDDSAFVDEHGLGCERWKDSDCMAAVEEGYTIQGASAILGACPAACGLCELRVLLAGSAGIQVQVVGELKVGAKELIELVERELGERTAQSAATLAEHQHLVALRSAYATGAARDQERSGEGR